ncbi:hypothetical protein GJ699_13955 [Duganella sp. FT80W]|uniref:Uncharacterized protein n=1 Tax=Duganella guangzhouensis TaxID=2666084 RepID=A0A6I2L3C3_9BURK|nr:hypothetical protein [Duganella guangzhouensis]MRW91096.1 hypothetical protein [Duganella guangzhouensis]
MIDNQRRDFGHIGMLRVRRLQRGLQIAQRLLYLLLNAERAAYQPLRTERISSWTSLGVIGMSPAAASFSAMPSRWEKANWRISLRRIVASTSSQCSADVATKEEQKFDLRLTTARQHVRPLLSHITYCGDTGRRLRTARW